MKKALWVIAAILSTIVGLYPILFFMTDKKFGLLSLKPAELFNDQLWNVSFYGHIAFGGIALLIGWLQFSKKIRDRYIKVHRNIGKTYVIAVLISGICGLVIALNATGGIISVLGFLSMAVIWLSTTLLGFNVIRRGNVDLHEKFMIFSYATCFSAVTLRIFLPLLVMTIGEFNTAYRIVAWLCWIPNIMVAYLIIRNKRHRIQYDFGA